MLSDGNDIIINQKLLHQAFIWHPTCQNPFKLNPFLRPSDSFDGIPLVDLLFLLNYHKYDHN